MSLPVKLRSRGLARLLNCAFEEGKHQLATGISICLPNTLDKSANKLQHNSGGYDQSYYQFRRGFDWFNVVDRSRHELYHESAACQKGNLGTLPVEICWRRKEKTAVQSIVIYLTPVTIAK
jgi:hypothetical protein